MTVGDYTTIKYENIEDVNSQVLIIKFSCACLKLLSAIHAGCDTYKLICWTNDESKLRCYSKGVYSNTIITYGGPFQPHTIDRK